MVMQPFMMANVASSTIACTSGSARVALGVQCNSVYLANLGSGAVFVNFGDATVVAAPATATAQTEARGNMCLPSGFYGVVGTNGQSNIAAICASGSISATLRITPGEGFL